MAAYPDARELCWQSVLGYRSEILWHAWATEDEPSEVRAWYEARGVAVEPTESGGGRIVGPDGKIVSFHPAGADYPRCDVAPDDDDRTVFIVSRATSFGD